MSNTNIDNEQIELATRGLRNAVQAYFRRYSAHADVLPKEVDLLVSHSALFLKQLIGKRRSLQNGLVYLRHHLWPAVVNELKKGDHAAALLLQHFLEQTLRLHDGLLLLVSGECRHPGDIKRAKKQRLSKLATQQERGDGYTKLFNAPGGYSGTGWDEWHDEQMGIRVRLIGQLQQYSKKRKSGDKIWDYLSSHGGQAFEAVLDQHESAMMTVGFTALKEQVVKDLKMLAAKTSGKPLRVVFQLHDKLEKIQYGDITLERQGDQFQVEDPKGALPNDYTVRDWERIMKLPQVQEKTKAPKVVEKAKPKAARKRRRIIEDSSDEEEVKTVSSKPNKKVIAKPKQATPPPPTKISGLTVKIRKEQQPPTPGETANLTTIKAKFGVHNDTLEASRQVLELEEANSSKLAKQEEQEAMALTIQQGESNIKSQRRVLKRVMAREQKDFNEIWDARELLREQLMALGNQILEEDPTVIDNEDRKDLLLTAHKHFQEAKKVVDEQEEFRRYLNSQGKHTPAEARFFARNLLLLLGQAYTNMGIATIELADVARKKTQYKTVESKRYLRQAIEELATAKAYAESLRLRAERDAEMGSNDMETKIDAVRADQLESLVLGWCGQALWRQGLRKEAWEKVDSAAALFADSSDNTDLPNEGLFEAMRELGTASYNAQATFADLCFSAMKALPLTGAAQEGNELLSYAKRSLQKAAELSQAIRKFSGGTIDSDSDEQNVIPSPKSILEERKEYELWWERRKAVANKPIAVDTIPNERQSSVSLPRSEVEPLGLLSMPTRRFVVQEGSSRNKKKRSKGPNPMYHQHSGELLSALPNYSDSPTLDAGDKEEETRFRAWGDQLLPKGELVYPSVAPRMPDHIRVMLQATN